MFVENLEGAGTGDPAGWSGGRIGTPVGERDEMWDVGVMA